MTVTRPPAVVGLVASTEAWTLPAGVSRSVVLPDGSGFVILGGLATGDTSTSRIVAVDPAGGSSRIVGDLALAVHDSAGAVIGGRFFVFGGGSTSTVSVVQAWTAGSAAEVATLPEARSDLSATTLGGTTYVVGGFNGSAMRHGRPGHRRRRVLPARRRTGRPRPLRGTGRDRTQLCGWSEA